VTPRLTLACLLVVAAASIASAQSAATAPPASDLKTFIGSLGSLDYPVRTNAARQLRRAAAADAVPALTQAARSHPDEYVRYRAFVLLTSLNDRAASEVARGVLRDRNDRLRQVAYEWLERHPDPALTATLLSLLQTEQAEFVRPALIGAVAALGDNPEVQRAMIGETGRGLDLFRSAVIEALGDYKARYAFDTLSAIAKQDGPLQDDAAIALGKLKDQKALETLAGLQRTAPRDVQPSIAAAICLLGINCDSHENYLSETLKFSDKNIGFQELLRGAAAGLGALGVSGRRQALDVLIDIGMPSRDPARAPIALALAAVALRNTPLMMKALEERADRDGAIELMAEGFDMLEEDLDKERFFMQARRTFWESPEGSPRRALMQRLIGKLDF